MKCSARLEGVVRIDAIQDVREEVREMLPRAVVPQQRPRGQALPHGGSDLTLSHTEIWCDDESSFFFGGESRIFLNDPPLGWVGGLQPLMDKKTRLAGLQCPLCIPFKNPPIQDTSVKGRIYLIFKEDLSPHRHNVHIFFFEPYVYVIAQSSIGCYNLLHPEYQ